MSDRTSNHPPRMDAEIQDFLLERRIRKVSNKTFIWHTSCLTRFAAFCYSYDVTSTKQISASLLRQFILSLEEAGHNQGGIANIFRSVKAFLNWYEIEHDEINWKNPVRKVQVKDSNGEPLEPISLGDFQKMLDACERKSLVGTRDRAVLMVLLDTGIRKAEITALKVDDLIVKTGTVSIQHGKGGKSRTVFVGATTRRALIAYLRQREAFLAHLERTYKQKPTDGLWISGTDGKQLTQHGIRQILRRRSKDAGVEEFGPHSFRRAFARNAWLQGMDIIAIQRLLGHSNLTVINRYIKSYNDDLRTVHEKHSPVDNL